MSIPRLLAPTLLIVVCTSWGAAQSSKETKPEAASVQVQAASPNGWLPGISSTKRYLSGSFDWSFSEDGLEFLKTPSGALHTGQSHLQFSPTQSFRGQAFAVTPDGPTCYSIRTYRVVRDDPQSDSTSAAGYSTCQPVTRFRIENAVIRLDTASH
jgi:hypothetical protein